MDELSIFISHIKEEKEIAQTLKSWIEDSFAGRCKVFVSSSPEDITPGENWLDSVKSALSGAQLEIVLCSHSSMTRPWINFEAGFAWATDMSIIPVCHSTFTIKDLPIPFSLFQAVELSNREACEKLFAAVAARLGLPKTPRVDYTELYSELSGHFASAPAPLEAAQPAGKSAQSRVGQKELPPECIAMLKLFLNSDELLDTHFRQSIQNNIKSDYFRDILLQEKLLHAAYNMMLPTRYSLSTKGKAYLVEHNLAGN